MARVRQQGAVSGRRRTTLKLLGDSDEMPERSLPASDLHRTFVALRIALQAYPRRFDAGPFHREALSHGDGRSDGRDLRIACDHGNQVSFGLSGRIRQSLANETVETQSDVCDRFLCALNVGKPTVNREAVTPETSVLTTFKSLVDRLTELKMDSHVKKAYSTKKRTTTYLEK